MLVWLAYYYLLCFCIQNINYRYTNKVQGIDYAYTLQGWIKAVNSEDLDPTKDQGKDGNNTPNYNPNTLVARDAFGYSLGYYTNDYKSIGLSNFIASKISAPLTPSLYNGNISHMVTTITNPTTGATLPQLTTYTYDQLNRLVHAKAYDNIDKANNNWPALSTYTGRYENILNYDANGNILQQRRRDETGTLIDNITYKYNNKTTVPSMFTPTSFIRKTNNRLYNVNETTDDFGTLTASQTASLNVTNPALTSTATDDIEDQGIFNTANVAQTNNYTYDAIGNLISDKQEQIANIEWTVYGKIKYISRMNTSNCNKPDLEFNYDASGNRISKLEKPRINGVLQDIITYKYTYYTRDAQGNTMAVYSYVVGDEPIYTRYTLKERNLYGSSRLGVDYSSIELISPIPLLGVYTTTLGNKHFEASNHLGNVLTLFTDKKIPVGTGTTISYYKADLVSSMDYSPFGAPLKGRTLYKGGANATTGLPNIATDGSRYGFNGMENDNEVKGAGNQQDYGARIYDNRLGKFLSIDPLTVKFSMRSPYLFADNCPITKVDFLGLSGVAYYQKKLDGYTIIVNKETGNSIIEKTTVTSVYCSSSKFRPTDYVAVTVETFEINTKGKITKITTVESELRFGLNSTSGGIDGTDSKILTKKSSAIKEKSSNSSVTKDNFVNAVADYAGKKNEDFKSGDFEGISTSDKTLESMKTLLFPIASAFNKGLGVLTELLLETLPDSNKNFHSKKFTPLEAKEATEVYKKDVK
ncbi:MAG: hypothetical protein H7331_08240 [Bacteroidia bacterium]|nr:hypothetical protein [Bacteroidia bacterium]